MKSFVNLRRPGSADITYKVEFDTPVDSQEMSQTANQLRNHLDQNGNQLLIGGENVSLINDPVLLVQNEDGTTRPGILS